MSAALPGEQPAKSRVIHEFMGKLHVARRATGLVVDFFVAAKFPLMIRMIPVAIFAVCMTI